MAIEVKGNVHDEKEIKQDDISKQDSLETYGLFVIRLRNEEVIKSIDDVIASIKKAIITPQVKGPL